MGDSQTIIDSPKSITGQFLSGTRGIVVPKNRHQSNGKSLILVAQKLITYSQLMPQYRLAFLPALLAFRGPENLL